MPPVSSLTINISKPSIIFSFNGEAFDSSLNKKAGLKFANKFNSFLNVNSAFSGLSSQPRLSHCGAPTAPNRTASAFLAAFKTFSGIGEPNFS